MAYPCIRSNSNGVLIGEMTEHHAKLAAHHFRIASASKKGEVYEIYLESRTPLIYRCTCRSYLFRGECKHGPEAAKIEKFFADLDPEGYRMEVEARREHRGVAVTTHKYTPPVA